MKKSYSTSERKTSSFFPSSKGIYLLLMVLFVCSFANAATRTASVNGNWNSTTTWGGAAIPTAADDVIINNGISVTVNIIAVCNTLIINGGNAASSVTISGINSLTVSGAVTINGGTGSNDHKIFDVAAGSLTAASISIAPTGSDNRYSRLSISSGTVTISGNITMNDVDVDRNQVIFTGAGTLNVGGTITGGALVPSTGTVNYNNNGAQTVGAYNYYNLTLSGSGTKTLAGAITGNGALTLDNNTNLAMSTYLLTLNGDLINNGSGTITGTTGGVTISGTNTQSIAGFTTTGAVSMTKTTGGAATLTGNVNGGSLSINGSGGIMSLGDGLTHTFTGAWSRGSGTLNGGSSTLRIGGDVTGTGSTFNAETSTVEFNRAGNQNLSSTALTYNNLILSGSGEKTFGAVATVSNTWSIVSPVKANLGTITTHSATILYLHGIGPRSGSWGALASTTASNKTDDYFRTGITGRINVASVIDNNYASYNNATGDLGGGIVGENTGPLVLAAPNGSVFINTKFASYGTPGGVYPNFTIGGCHAANSRAVTTGLLGNTSAAIPASGVSFNTAFGDPCNGTIKTYSIVATYALPICNGSSPGIITGSTPTGGTGTYTYVWSQSTTVNGTYTNIPGATNKDYTPGTLTATTYYKRTVTSGIFTDETIVIVPVISNTAPSAPTITSLCSGSTLSVPASTIPGTYVEWFSGSCGSTVIATGITYNPTVTGTYYARYKNVCSTSACSTGVSSSAPANTVVVTPTNPSSICITGTAQTASLPYTTIGTSSTSTYSIIWSPSGFLINIANRTLPSAPNGTITLDIPSNVPAGTYTGAITIKTAAGCISASKTFALTIGKVAGVASSTQTLCMNTALTAITHSTLNANGIGTPTGLPAGVTASWASNTITISGTPTASGTFNYSIPLTGSCAGSANATGTITVNPLPTTPTVGTPIQPNCTIPTGSVDLSGLPFPGTLIRTGTTASNIPTTGATMNIPLAPGTYNFTVDNGTCTSSATANVVINSAVTTTWNGSSWDNGDPTSTTTAIINGNYSASSNGDINACSLTINSGILNIEAGKFVVIQNNLTVAAGATLDVFHMGSLVMVNDAPGMVSGTGTTIVRKVTTPTKKLDYVYWSSPVTNSTISSTFLGWRTDRAFEYNNNWIYATNMIPAKGYIITAPNSGGVAFVDFQGQVNNGIQKITGVTPSNFYLVGNPYPSAIDADAFLDTNSAVLDGTLYFWTHNTAIQLASGIDPLKAGSGAYAFTSDDYASYNGVGGVAAAPAPSALTGGINTNIPSGKIASCQGFFASTLASSPVGAEIVFNNAMRLTSTGGTLDNTQFFKTKNPKAKTTKTREKHRIWLNLTNKQGAFKQTLLGYVTDATNQNESRFDGETMDGNSFVDFYSVNENKNLVIQGRALPFDNDDQVALGYKSAIAGEFKISIEQVDGLLTNQEVFLEDKLTNTEFDLKKGNYTFNTAVGTFNNRFVLKYKNTNQSLGTDDFDGPQNKVIVAVKNKQIKINSFAETIDKVVVYDLSGKLIYQKNNVNSNELLLSDFVLNHQALIVKTTLQNGTIATDKVVY